MIEAPVIELGGWPPSYGGSIRTGSGWCTGRQIPNTRSMPRS